jgi:hypothetical protein
MKTLVEQLAEKLDMWEGPRFKRGAYPDLDAAEDAVTAAAEQVEQARNVYRDLPAGDEKDRAKAAWKAADDAFQKANDSANQEYEKAKADAEKES